MPIIAFEGPDGVGKSSLVTALSEELGRRAISCELASFPGKAPGTIGKLVYEVHHNPKGRGLKSISATALQALHIAAHIDYLENASQRRSLVLLDRFWWSTVVYGKVSGANQPVILKLVEAEKLLWKRQRFAVILIAGKPYRSFKSWPRLHNEYLALARSEARKYPVYRFRNEGNLIDSAKRLANLLIGSVLPKLTTNIAHANYI